MSAAGRNLHPQDAANGGRPWAWQHAQLFTGALSHVKPMAARLIGASAFQQREVISSLPSPKPICHVSRYSDHPLSPISLRVTRAKNYVVEKALHPTRMGLSEATAVIRGLRSCRKLATSRPSHIFIPVQAQGRGSTRGRRRAGGSCSPSQNMARGAADGHSPRGFSNFVFLAPRPLL